MIEERNRLLLGESSEGAQPAIVRFLELRFRQRALAIETEQVRRRSLCFLVRSAAKETPAATEETPSEGEEVLDLADMVEEELYKLGFIKPGEVIVFRSEIEAVEVEP